MPTEKEWKEPLNCPKCSCGWAILIKAKDIKEIFCSNPKCCFSWRAQGKTLFDAVKCWNKICEDYEGRDKPKTPLLVEIVKRGVNTVFRTKDLTKGKT